MNQQPIPTTSDHQHWMQLALQQAKLAAQIQEVPVGAVIVKDMQIIAAAHNAPIATSDPTAHAEILALRAAGKKLQNYRLVDCDMYVTLEPCCMCAGAIVHARLRKVYYATQDPKSGAAGSMVDIFSLPLNHNVITQPGIMANDCSKLLKDFFVARRKKST